MRALDGRVVATTRAGRSDEPLVAGLADEGATVRLWPTLVFEPPADPRPLTGALEALDRFDWIAFTSARTVDAVTALRPQAPRGPRVAAVGAATAAALERVGWPVAIVGHGGAEALAATWAERHELDGAEILLPASSLARSTLADALTAAGARVTRVEAYRTRPAPPDRPRVLDDLAVGVDAVTFASPSAVRSLAACLGADWPDALAGAVAVAIGPTTSAALTDAGVPVERIVRADRPSVDAVVRATVRALAPGRAAARERIS